MKRILLLLITLLSLSQYAIASVPVGWYVEGDIGGSRVSSANLGTGTSNKNSGVAFGLNAGYKFMPFFSAEIGGIKYANVNINAPSGTQAATDKVYSVDLAGKGIWPVSAAFDLFAKLGVAYIHSDITIKNATAATGLGIPKGTNSNTNAFFGIGAEYFYTPNFPIVLQWTRARGNNTVGVWDFYSIGLGYVFG